MSEQFHQQHSQNLDISDSVLKDVQIGGIAGQDLELTQIQGEVGVVNVFGTVQVPQASVSVATPLSRDEYRWRETLLSKVQQFWVDGVLKKSLYTQVFIELGLEERSDYIQNPLEEGEEFVSTLRQVFSAGTSASDIFDNIGTGRTLLILGEPGSGKTVTLLKLAESLIKRAENNLSQPLPVVVNLSSWAKQRKSINDWLAQELFEIYQVSQFLGKTWVAQEQLVLLLDGLDEVSAQYRDACVQALNQFIQAHGRTEIVVCSRIRDYETFSERLKLRSAIYVQPLTSQQITLFLEQAGEPLRALKEVLQRNSELREFASSPLILSIMSLAYQGASVDKIIRGESIQNYRQHLLNTYIERMFEGARKASYTRKAAEFTKKYSRKKAHYWLIWMAQRMTQNSQTVFLIERIQPRWLQKKQRIQYQLESALIVGLIVWLSLRPSVWESVWMIFWLRWLIILFSRNIETVEILRWSWKKAKNTFRRGLSTGLRAGLIFGLLFGLIFGLIFGLRAGLIYWPMEGLSILELKSKNIPNQGIWSSLKNGLRAGLSIGLITGLIAGLIFGLIFGLITELSTGLRGGLVLGLAFGLGTGLIIGLSFGGFACLKHFFLRLMLYRMGYIPWNYTQFLDYAAERLFLQKVGGGYIFIHRMLLEHFAGMKSERTRC